jgi:APA family basic amino acid/polyamine antiporter
VRVPDPLRFGFQRRVGTPPAWSPHRSVPAGRATTDERTGEVGTKLRRAISPRVLTIFVINVAEETQEPSRSFPRALFAGIAVAGTLYLVVTLTASFVVPTDQLSGSDAPLLEVVEVGPLGISTKLFAFIALMAVSNSALINMIMASRIVYGMADQGIVARLFARVLPERRTPFVAIIFTTLIAVVLITTGDLSTLADTTVLLLLFVFTIVNIAVLVLRRERVEHEHFTAPSAFPVLGAIVSVR